MLRREFLQGLASITGSARSRARPRPPVVTIEIVLSEDAAEMGAGRHLDALRRRLRDSIGDALPDARLSVRSRGTIELPNDAVTDHEQALDYWKSESVPRSSDAKLLILSDEQCDGWNVGGYANLLLGVAVMRCGERLGEPKILEIAVHEIGHCLGLSHDHADEDRNTIMTGEWDEPPSFELSRESRNLLERRYGSDRNGRRSSSDGAA